MDLAVEKGVERFVLLSASILEVGDGPMMSRVSGYVAGLGVEWAALRPTWFMGKRFHLSNSSIANADVVVENREFLRNATSSDDS